MNRYLLVLLVVLGSEVAQASEGKTGPRHPPEFWQSIVDHDFKVPEGESADGLVLELRDYLGSPDPKLRDGFGYSIPVAWIYRDHRISGQTLRTLLRTWQANLQVGVGETGTDRVFLRSFSALDLSILAGTDNKDAFLEPAEFTALLG